MRYASLSQLHDPLTDRYVPREFGVGIHNLFRFNRLMPACLVGSFQTVRVDPNIFNTMPWDEVVVDNDGMFSKASSPTQVTVRTPGLWLIAWSLQKAPSSDTTEYMEVRCRRNRIAQLNNAVVTEDFIGEHGPSRALTVVLAEGEFVELDVWISSPSDDSQELIPPSFLGMQLLASPDLEAVT